MRRSIFCLACVCALAALGASAGPAANGKDKDKVKDKGKATMCVLHAKLRASTETTGSTSTAKGHTLIRVRADGTIVFKTQINNKNNETFVAGHIHLAPVGVAGPVVVPLFGDAMTTARHIKQSGVATASAGTTGSALCASPSAYYVNYHTTAFPAGAIRGQLR
jgi:hypothetical protein